VGVTVNSIHFSVGASSEGGYASVGVYSGDGNTLLIDSGPKSTESAAVLSTTLSAPVTLLAGVSYLFCYTNDNAASAVHTGGDASQVVNGLLNAGGTQIGVASNPSASGQLPATLGSLTAAANTGMPLIKLQN
jgi:hypothetical protein